MENCLMISPSEFSAADTRRNKMLVMCASDVGRPRFAYWKKAAGPRTTLLAMRCSSTSQEALGNGERTQSDGRFLEPKAMSNGLSLLPSATWKSPVGKRYSERLTSILTALQTLPDSSWVDKVLDPWNGLLRPKEQSILLIEQKSWSRSLAILSWLKRQDCYVSNVVHYNLVLKALGRAHKFELLEELWEEMEKEVIPTSISYSTVIDAYSKAEYQEKALHWFEAMKLKGFKLNGVPKNLQNVLSLEETVGSYSETVETCNAMIDVYGIVGRYADASRVFSDMINAGIAPDIVTFKEMIKVCGLAGSVEEAEALYLSMDAFGLTPDVATFSILIRLLVGDGKLQRALEYFSKMKEIGVVPDQQDFQTFLSELARPAKTRRRSRMRKRKW